MVEQWGVRLFGLLRIDYVCKRHDRYFMSITSDATLTPLLLVLTRYLLRWLTCRSLALHDSNGLRGLHLPLERLLSLSRNIIDRDLKEPMLNLQSGMLQNIDALFIGAELLAHQKQGVFFFLDRGKGLPGGPEMPSLHGLISDLHIL